jgi:hypothetical protein
LPPRADVSRTAADASTSSRSSIRASWQHPPPCRAIRRACTSRPRTRPS